MTAAFLQSKMRKRCLRLYRQCRVSIGGSESLLVEPLTYMNRSGEIAHHFIPSPYTARDLVVVCDNLDLPPGMIRIRKGGSSAGHNGLKSLIGHIGSAEFTRIYVGIGRPAEGTTVVDHVLGVPAESSEQVALSQGVRLAMQAVLDLCAGKAVEEVARAYNKRNNGA